MKSSDNEAQRFAALAIANIASAVFNRITMVQDDILQHLIPYITNEDSDFMGRQYCAMALGNLAAEPENHEDIVKLEGIAALISLLKSEEVEVRAFAHAAGIEYSPQATRLLTPLRLVLLRFTPPHRLPVMLPLPSPTSPPTPTIGSR